MNSRQRHRSPHEPLAVRSAADHAGYIDEPVSLAHRVVRWLSVYSAAFVVSACALVSRVPDPALAVQQMKTRPERMVVLAVANPPESLMLRAGSTAGGYGAEGGYAAGGSAQAEVAALARRYGLREVSAWPIPVLKVHCSMLEIVGDASRDKMLAQLAADPRVRLAQPLQTFDLLADTQGSGNYAVTLPRFHVQQEV